MGPKVCPSFSIGPFAVKRYETTKKIKFMFISQKCSKYYNLSRFHINLFFIFFRVLYLSTAKGPIYLPFRSEVAQTTFMDLPYYRLYTNVWSNKWLYHENLRNPLQGFC